MAGPRAGGHRSVGDVVGEGTAGHRVRTQHAVSTSEENRQKRGDAEIINYSCTVLPARRRWPRRPQPGFRPRRDANPPNKKSFGNRGESSLTTKEALPVGLPDLHIYYNTSPADAPPPYWEVFPPPICPPPGGGTVGRWGPPPAHLPVGGQVRGTATEDIQVPPHLPTYLPTQFCPHARWFWRIRQIWQFSAAPPEQLANHPQDLDVPLHVAARKKSNQMISACRAQYLTIATYPSCLPSPAHPHARRVSASPLSTGPPRDRGALHRHRHASATTLCDSFRFRRHSTMA